MMSNFLRRSAAVVSLFVGAVGCAIAPPSAGAATTSTPPGVVSNVLSNTDGYLTSLRTFFLCNSATCKKERVSLLHKAQSSMSKLTAQSSSVTRANVSSKYRGTLQLFVSDVHLLAASYHVYFTTRSTIILSGEIGNIFYLTSDIGSDVNVLRAAAKNSHVTFKLWVEGEAATLVAMQTDASALQSTTATAPIGIYANQLLEQECHVMMVHANGPTSSFDAQLVTFAHSQSLISQSEILFLRGKKAPLTETQVARLNVKVAAEFAQIVKSETALIKKK